MRRSLLSRIVGVGAAVAASAGVLLAAAPAHATQTDVIAVAGSDTTQDVMAKILQADGVAGKTFNILAGNNQSTPLTVPADGHCLAHTYHNITTGIWPASGSPNQSAGELAAPNGSTEGKTALTDAITGAPPFNGGGVETAPNGCIDIARSSSARSGSNPASYEFYAFAQDAVTWGSTSLNAPAQLTQAQVQGIYNCTYTDWSQVGGNPGPIQRVLPQGGSGTLNSFMTEVLGVATTSGTGIGNLTVSAPNCPPIEQIQESQYYDLFHGSHQFGPQGDATQYPNAIGPMSNGKFVFEASHDSNPTLDVRAGWRPGALVVQQGSDGFNPVYGVLWTGSAWALNTGSVVGAPTVAARQESITTTTTNPTVISLNPVNTVVAGPVASTANTFTLTGAAGTFHQTDVNGVVSNGTNTGIGSGTVITTVSADGSTATVTVKSTATSSGTINIASHFQPTDAGATISTNGNIPAGTKISFVINGTTAEIDHGASAAGTVATTTITPVTQVHNVTGLTTTAAGTTVTASASMFSSADVGLTFDSTCTFPGTVITAFNSPTSITISPGAQTACTGLAARIGNPVVSPGAILATSGSSAPYPGGRFVYNVLDNTTPGSTSYAQARDLVGYQDAPGGAVSPLCSSHHDTANGGVDDLISDNGFLPIPPHTSTGGNTNISCFKF